MPHQFTCTYHNLPFIHAHQCLPFCLCLLKHAPHLLLCMPLSYASCFNLPLFGGVLGFERHTFKEVSIMYSNPWVGAYSPHVCAYSLCVCAYSLPIVFILHAYSPRACACAYFPHVIAYSPFVLAYSTCTPAYSPASCICILSTGAHIFSVHACFFSASRAFLFFIWVQSFAWIKARP